jgi:hypothetical protein
MPACRHPAKGIVPWGLTTRASVNTMTESPRTGSRSDAGGTMSTREDGGVRMPRGG